MNTTEFLTITSAIVPDRVATIFEGHHQPYGKFQERVMLLADGLAKLGVSPGDRVGTIHVNCPQHIEAYFASAMLDAIYVPMNFRVRSDELTYMVNNASPKVMFVGERYVDLVQSVAPKVDSVKQYIALDGVTSPWPSYEEFLASASAEERFPQADDGDITIILYTAGTTGEPKGVMLTHNSFSSYILSSVSPVDPEVEERNILTVPLHHVAGIQAVLSAIYSGRSLIIQRQFEPKDWMDLVQGERANRAMMVPTMLKQLLDHPEFHQYDLSSLEVITYGAAPMPIPVIRRAIQEFPGVRFINAFGQTETASTITMLPPEDHVLEGSAEEVELKMKRLSSIGRPLDDVEVRIVSEDGDDIPVGATGEIVARGDRLMKGYWGNEVATRETVRNGWLYTGDLGYFDDDGYIYLSGRAKDFIKRGGEMIAPEEVEQVLHSHPAVDEAAIIGVPDESWGELVRAVVVAKSEPPVTEDALIEYCRERLASFKRPESVVFINELPRNPLGKVLKRVLREQHGAP